MPAAERRKGATFERSIATYLGVRRHLSGPRVLPGARTDEGDIALEGWQVECRNRARMELGPWLRETVEQQTANRDRWHALVIKLRGTADPGEQAVVMTVRQWREIVTLIEECGQ